METLAQQLHRELIDAAYSRMVSSVPLSLSPERIAKNMTRGRIDAMTQITGHWVSTGQFSVGHGITPQVGEFVGKGAYTERAIEWKHGLAHYPEVSRYVHLFDHNGSQMSPTVCSSERISHEVVEEVDQVTRALAEPELPIDFETGVVDFSNYPAGSYQVLSSNGEVAVYRNNVQIRQVKKPDTRQWLSGRISRRFY